MRYVIVRLLTLLTGGVGGGGGWVGGGRWLGYCTHACRDPSIQSTGPEHMTP